MKNKFIAYKNDSLEELVEKVVHNHDDGAAYYLLTEKVRQRLNSIMFEHSIDIDDQYDTIMELYLYLRDGKNGKDNEPNVPYQMMLTLNNAAAFIPWITVVFKRFIERKQQQNISTVSQSFDSRDNEVSADSSQNEQIFEIDDLEKAILIIETINETFSAPERYLFFSDLYALRYPAEEKEDLKSVLNCTENNIRVMRHRIKERVRKVALQITALQ